MKKQLTRVAPLRCGTVFGVLYGIMALIFAVFFAAATAVLPSKPAAPAAFGGVLVALLPVAYAILGFIGGVIAAALYNVVAKWTGGLEFEVTDVSPPAKYVAVGSVKVSTRPPDQA
jgi:hypothetical protein